MINGHWKYTVSPYLFPQLAVSLCIVLSALRVVVSFYSDPFLLHLIFVREFPLWIFIYIPFWNYHVSSLFSCKWLRHLWPHLRNEKWLPIITMSKFISLSSVFRPWLRRDGRQRPCSSIPGVREKATVSWKNSTFELPLWFVGPPRPGHILSPCFVKCFLAAVKSLF